MFGVSDSALTVRLRGLPPAGGDGFGAAILVLPLLRGRIHHGVVRCRIDRLGAVETRKSDRHRVDSALAWLIVATPPWLAEFFRDL